MFNSLPHAEAAFRGSINGIINKTTLNPKADIGTELAQLSDAFDYVLNEAIRRGRARLVWHQEPPQQYQEVK